MLYHLLEEPAVSQISGIPPSQKCHSVATATVSEHCTQLHCTITQFRCSNVKCSNVQMFNISNLAATVVSEHCAKLQRTIIQQWLRNTRVLQDRLLIAVCHLLKLNHCDDYHRMNVYVCASCNILTTIIANIFVLKKGAYGVPATYETLITIIICMYPVPSVSIICASCAILTTIIRCASGIIVRHIFDPQQIPGKAFSIKVCCQTLQNISTDHLFKLFKCQNFQMFQCSIKNAPMFTYLWKAANVQTAKCCNVKVFKYEIFKR